MVPAPACPRVPPRAAARARPLSPRVREKVPIEAVLKYAQISSFRGAGEAARDAVA
jgi:hypothetical protein